MNEIHWSEQPHWTPAKDAVVNYATAAVRIALHAERTATLDYARQFVDLAEQSLAELRDMVPPVEVIDGMRDLIGEALSAIDDAATLHVTR